MVVFSAGRMLAHHRRNGEVEELDESDEREEVVGNPDYDLDLQCRADRAYLLGRQCLSMRY